MKLYGAADSIALAPHIALVESGMAYDFDLVDHHAHVCEDGGSYFDINPSGYVPAMRLDDGSILTESIAVIWYIAESASDRMLIGGDARYRTLQWLCFASTELHQRFMRFAQPGLSEELANATKDQLRERFSHASKALDETGWLVGDALSVADIFLYVCSRWLQYIDIDANQWPQIASLRTAMETRPSVRRALAEQGIG